METKYIIVDGMTGLPLHDIDGNTLKFDDALSARAFANGFYSPSGEYSITTQTAPTGTKDKT